MSIAAGVIAPHAPILIPEIGGDQIAAAVETVDGLKRAAQTVNDQSPETLIFISPHSQMSPFGFAVQTRPALSGSFSQFGEPDIAVSFENDLDAVDLIEEAARDAGVPLVPQDDEVGERIDWGVLVPYWFLGDGRPVVSISISNLPLEKHFQLGEAVYAALGPVKRNYVFVASGDMSHRLAPESPYGFSEDGPIFDDKVIQIVKTGQLQDLLEIDRDQAESAGECGLRSFVTLAGVFAKCHVEPSVLSYEGPFGIGYLVSIILNKGEE